MLGTSFESVFWMASRIARARALKADSALCIFDENRQVHKAHLPVVVILASQDIDV